MAYRIRAVGRVVGRGEPKDMVIAEIGDMLRYDCGDVENIELEPSRYGYCYIAIVHIEHYTKARWDSFLIKTEQISHTSEPAPKPRFNSQDEVARFIRTKE